MNRQIMNLGTAGALAFCALVPAACIEKSDTAGTPAPPAAANLNTPPAATATAAPGATAGGAPAAASAGAVKIVSLADGHAVSALHDVQIVSEDAQSVAFKATGPSPALELPAVAHYPQKGVLVHLTIDAPDNTLVQLFYRSDNSQKYAKDRVLANPIKEGSNEVTFDLTGIPLVGRLRIDPGRVLGDYKITMLEVVAVQ